MNDNLDTWSPDDEATHVHLSEAALQHLKKKLNERGSGIGLRLAVKTSGCNGYKYIVDYVDTQGADDTVFPSADPALAVYVDKMSLPFVIGTEIDFVRQGLNESFVFKNPNQSGQCGCGESFSVDG